MLSMEERAKIYNKEFPRHPPLGANKRWITGAWYCWRSKAGKIYGGYPTGYLKRLYALFPDCGDILHLFSGGLDSSEKGVRFDINPELNPDVLGDVRNLRKHFDNNSFDIVIADPPYEKKDFEVYKQEPFNKGNAIRDLYHIVKPGGYLVWLDLLIPMYKKKEWELCGLIAVAVGTNMRVRACCIFKNSK